MDSSQLARLQGLLANSQRAVQSGNSYYEEAYLSYETCKDQCAKLDSAHAKLELVSRELTKQLQLISQLVSQLRGRNSYLVTSLEDLHSSDEQILKNLADIFKKLTEKPVDRNISSNKTLFDYVDTDSVAELKTQALQEMQDLKSIQAQSQRILQTIEINYERLLGSSKDASLAVEYIPTFATDKLGLQMNEITSMSTMLSTIMAHHDRVTQLHAKPADKSIDVVALERRNDTELGAQVAKMLESLQRVKSIAVEVESRMQRYNNAFKNAVKLLTSLETFGLEAKNRLVELGTLENSFEERKEGARFIFEELANLATWYDLFYTAYAELLFEIDRRHKEHRRQQQVVDAYQRELNAMWKVESQKREGFYEYYGKYLPTSLCPSIMEASTRFQVFPERHTTELPELETRPDRSQIDIALSELSDETLENLVLSPSLSRTPRNADQNSNHL